MADMISFCCEGMVGAVASDLPEGLLQDLREREFANVYRYL
jgi:hypothetical protein